MWDAKNETPKVEKKKISVTWPPQVLRRQLSWDANKGLDANMNWDADKNWDANKNWDATFFNLRYFLITHYHTF